MGSTKKIEKSRDLIHKNQRIFKCPVCGGTMHVKRENSLVCRSGHNFDLSRKGYLNLLMSGKTPVYSKELFESRRKVCEAGFYDPLIGELTEIIAEYRNSVSKTGIAILDAGCGEGSHLNGIFQRLNAFREDGSGPGLIGPDQAGPGKATPEKEAPDLLAGIDISKEGIQIAARGDTGIIWCVSDLAGLPFRDGSFDIVLNILSPANYGEFGRILNRRGMLIKVVPGERYLEEIREALGGKAVSGGESTDGGSNTGGPQNEGYSNERVVRYFEEKMETADILDIGYRFHVEELLLPHLIKMTPLTWGKDAGSLLSGKGISEITVDLTVLIGRH